MSAIRTTISKEGERMDVVNVILAGGASRRFGEPKASYMYQGKPLYEHVKKQLLKGQTVIISHPSLLTFLKKEVNEMCGWMMIRFADAGRLPACIRRCKSKKQHGI